MQNKNILHVVNISFAIPYFLGNQISYFKNKGYNLHIICSPSQELVYYSIKLGFKYKGVCILRKISFFSDLKAILSTSKYIRENNINIVVGHTPKGALIAMVAAFLMKVPKRIYFRHGLVYETATGIKRLVLKEVDRITSLLSTKIVCVSPSIYKKSIEDRLNPEDKQFILSKGTCNGIDIERFSKENINVDQVLALRKKLHIKDDYFVIGFTGRLVKDKGIIELVEAFEKVYARNQNVLLLLVGMFEERDALPNNIIEKIKSHPSIINTGYVDNEVIENYYALMDIFVLPSYREGFPTSVLEASAMGLPVITTRATGCIDSIIENKTGLFVNHSTQEMADAISTFLLDNNKKKSFGQQGKLFVQHNFNQEKIWKDIEKLYIL